MALFLLTDNMHRGTAIMILISDLIGSADGFQFFDTLWTWTDIDIDVPVIFENETIAFVHIRYGQTNLTNANIALSFDLEQTLLSAIIGGDMVETTSNTASHISNTVSEVAQKFGRFMFLHFAILDWSSAEQIVQLNGQNGRSASLILWCLQTKPKMNVPWQSLLVILFGLVERMKRENKSNESNFQFMNCDTK